MDDLSNVLPFVPQPPVKKARGGRMKKGAPETLEYMRGLNEARARRRAERAAQGLLPTSGRGRLKPLTDKEIRERALQTAADLFSDARAMAVNKLVDQIDHKDPGIAQKAAIKVLEYTDGKPNQPVTARTENTTKVVYETAAIPPDVFMPGFGLDNEDEAATA